VREGGNIGLRATNLREFPITFTLRVRTRGLTAEGPRTITETLDAEQSRLVMMLRENGGDRKGRYRISCDWTIGDKDAMHDDEYLYLLPYETGKSYRVLQGFGSRFSHRGLEQYAVDFNMSVGTPVHAARGGVVAKIEESHNKGCWDDGCGAFANYIVILHNDGTTGEYYHLRQKGALVDVGDHVVAGLFRETPDIQRCRIFISRFIAPPNGATHNPFLYVSLARPGSYTARAAVDATRQS
jgi:murein DD-endopeptidase MepM/ murein hydrolase activator NlpD